MSFSYKCITTAKREFSGFTKHFLHIVTFWWDRPTGERPLFRASWHSSVNMCNSCHYETRDNERIYYYCVQGCCCRRPLFRAKRDKRATTEEWERESDKTIPFPVDRLCNDNGYETIKTSHKPKSDAENLRNYTAMQTKCHRGECA